MKVFWTVALLALCIGTSPAIAQEIHPYPKTEYDAPSTDDGEFVVDFIDSDSPSRISSILSGLGLQQSEFTLFSNEDRWVRVKDLSASALEALKSDPEVEEIEPNYYYTALFTPNDPYYKHQWHLDQIGMKEAWDYPAGADVTVAVIDTGVAYEKYSDGFEVEDLQGVRFVKPHNFVDGNDHAGDDHGHGTHVAGTIAQVTNNSVGVAGVAPHVRIMPLKVLNSSGYGTLSGIAEAIRYAADNGANVINMSLGGPFPSRILHKAIQYAREKDVVIVCAAGNSGRSGLSYPAAYSECISVSAVRLDGQLSWYSSFGKGLTIAAPGGDMNVDQNNDGLMDGVLQNTIDPQDHSKQGYFLFQGTSMAAPHVAAAAAILVSHGITDPDKVKEYLTNTATMTKGGTPEQYGAGVLNVHEALKSAFFFRRLKMLFIAFFFFIILAAILNKGRGRLEKIEFNGAALLGVLAGSTGLFFLGFLPFIGHSFFITHSAEEWPLAIAGAGWFNSPIFFSCIPAIAVSILLFPFKRLTPFAVGFATSVAAFLAFQAWSPTVDITWIPGRFLEAGWLLANATLSGIVAVVSSFRLR